MSTHELLFQGWQDITALVRNIAGAVMNVMDSWRHPKAHGQHDHRTGQTKLENSAESRPRITKKIRTPCIGQNWISIKQKTRFQQTRGLSNFDTLDLGQSKQKVSSVLNDKSHMHRHDKSKALTAALCAERHIENVKSTINKDLHNVLPRAFVRVVLRTTRRRTHPAFEHTKRNTLRNACGGAEPQGKKGYVITSCACVQSCHQPNPFHHEEGKSYESSTRSKVGCKNGMGIKRNLLSEPRTCVGNEKHRIALMSGDIYTHVKKSSTRTKHARVPD